jgi:hypothetical protein
MAVRRTTPLKNVRKRNPDVTTELGTADSSFAAFRDSQYAYGKLPPLPKNGEQLFHEYRDGWKHASLALGDGKGGVVPASTFEFWCMTVELGYGSGGQDAQSAFYSAYYSRTFKRLPVKITGRVPTEKYKEDMQLWVRDAQIRLARGEPRMYLNIPAANIRAWGYIPSFAGGQETNFGPAPEITFEFNITRDTRTDRKGALSQQVIAYFLDPNDKYWRRESRIFVDATYDALSSEIEIEKKKAAEKVAATVKNVTDFFDRGPTGPKAGAIVGGNVSAAGDRVITGVSNIQAAIERQRLRESRFGRALGQIGG